MNASNPANQLLNADELAKQIPLASGGVALRLARQRKIPFLKIGHRTVRFSLPKVLAALDKLEVKSIG